MGPKRAERRSAEVLEETESDVGAIAFLGVSPAPEPCGVGDGKVRRQGARRRIRWRSRSRRTDIDVAIWLGGGVGRRGRVLSLQPRDLFFGVFRGVWMIEGAPTTLPFNPRAIWACPDCGFQHFFDLPLNPIP